MTGNIGKCNRLIQRKNVEILCDLIRHPVCAGYIRLIRQGCPNSIYWEIKGGGGYARKKGIDWPAKKCSGML